MTNFADQTGRSTRGGRGDATRARIAQAAVELVAELGWDAVTTRAVAARAGVNPALVHYHFGSMDVLLRSAVVAALEQEIGQAVVPFTTGVSLPDALAGATDAIGHFDPETPTATLLIEAMIRAVRDPELSRLIVDSLAEFRELIADRVRAAAASAPTAAAGAPTAAWGAPEAAASGPMAAADVPVAAAGTPAADLPPDAIGVFVAAALDGLLLHRIVDPSTDIDGFRDVIVRLFQPCAPPIPNPPNPSAAGGTS
jgi:AcrR family transcriptional regulator